MPEPNTPWHAWSGTVNGNKPAQYVKACRACAAASRPRQGQGAGSSGRRTPAACRRRRANALRAYFPGNEVRRPDAAPTPTTSAPCAASPGPSRPASSRAPTRRSRRSRRRQEVLDRRDRLDRDRRRQGRLDRSLSGRFEVQLPEARRRRLVRRQGPDGRLPRRPERPTTDGVQEPRSKGSCSERRPRRRRRSRPGAAGSSPAATACTCRRRSRRAGARSRSAR